MDMLKYMPADDAMYMKSILEITDDTDGRQSTKSRKVNSEPSKEH